MNTKQLGERFSGIGARLKFADRPARGMRSTSGTVSLDVQTDRQGESFLSFVGRLGYPSCKCSMLNLQIVTCCSSSATRTKSIGSSAVMTNATGLLLPFRRTPPWGPLARQKKP